MLLENDEEGYFSLFEEMAKNNPRPKNFAGFLGLDTPEEPNDVCIYQTLRYPPNAKIPRAS